MNGSLDVQHNVGFGTVVDAAYVFSLRRNINMSQQLNAVPMYAQYNPTYYSAWTGQLYENVSGRALSDNYFRPMAGLGAMTRNDFRSSANYHSLQVSVRRAMKQGLSYGLSYTFSKIMSYTAIPAYPNVPFFKYWYYGPSYNGAPHILAVNYIYQIPGLGKRFNIAPLGWVTDNWSVSGITAWQSHGRIGAPGISFTGTSTNNPAPNMTGSAEGARMFAVGNPTTLSSAASTARFSTISVRTRNGSTDRAAWCRATTRWAGLLRLALLARLR
jgi:hypothetical protein